MTRLLRHHGHTEMDYFTAHEGISFGASGLGPAFDRPLLIAIALSTGLLSNVIPYGIDQFVMQQITRSRFAFLQALLPVTAAVVGFVSLGQRPGGRELTGIGLVIVAIMARGGTDR